MIDPSEMELTAMASCLAPLGEYVGAIGMQRPLADYSKDEVLMLIDVVVTAYQEHMLVEHERTGLPSTTNCGTPDDASTRTVSTPAACEFQASPSISTPQQIILVMVDLRVLWDSSVAATSMACCGTVFQPVTAI